MDEIEHLRKLVKELTFDRDVAREEVRLWISHWLDTLTLVKSVGSPEIYCRAVEIVNSRNNKAAK